MSPLVVLNDHNSIKTKNERLEMKAQHVQIFYCEGVMDYIHGGGVYKDAIFFPKNGILMSFNEYKNEVSVHRGKLSDFTYGEFGTDGAPIKNHSLPPKIIGEIEVPFFIFIQVKGFIQTQDSFEKERSDFTERIESFWKTAKFGGKE